MTDLNDLYQELVMEHYRKPSNYKKLDQSDRSADGYNPFCGDIITVELSLEGDHISDVGFQGKGCAISRASASMMTEAVKGKSREEAEHIFQGFHALLTKDESVEIDHDALGDLEVMSGVADYPTRVKCATLSWNTLKSALRDEKETVSTE